MFPRPSSSLHHQSIRLANKSVTPVFNRSVSLSLFRDKKDPITEKIAVPSIHHTGTSGAFYPPLKLRSAVSARAKRDKRRLPIFPDGYQWTGILGGTAGDDAWVVGKYYLGKSNLFLCPGAVVDRRGCRWRRSMEYERKRATTFMVTATYALLGFGM